MTAPTTIAPLDAKTRMKRGRTYRATTTNGETTGEYLGLEAPHGDLAILLRDSDRVYSLAMDSVMTIERLAA